MRTPIAVTLGIILSAAPAFAAPAGSVVAAEDLCQINRGQDQLRPVPGLVLQEGDIVKCIGRTKVKAILGRVLVQFGPLSETKVISASPVGLELTKGALRAMSEPGATVPFSIRTRRSLVETTSGDVYIRYNASSEFTEVVAVEGTAQAQNIGPGSSGNVTLKPMETSLLSPESPPTQASPLSERELRGYTRDTDLAIAPLQGGDLFSAIGPTVERIDDAYGDARRQFARPSLPANAPYRTLDSRRQAFTLPQFDQPGRDTAAGGATLEFKYSFDQPREKAQ
jgi:hypothetical protein